MLADLLLRQLPSNPRIPSVGGQNLEVNSRTISNKTVAPTNATTIVPTQAPLGGTRPRELKIQPPITAPTTPTTTFSRHPIRQSVPVTMLASQPAIPPTMTQYRKLIAKDAFRPSSPAHLESRYILASVRRNTVLAVEVLLLVILVMGILGVLQMQNAILR